MVSIADFLIRLFQTYGVLERGVIFRVNGVQMTTTTIWDKRQATQVRLHAAVADSRLFLPLIQR